MAGECLILSLVGFIRCRRSRPTPTADDTDLPASDRPLRLRPLPLLFLFRRTHRRPGHLGLRTMPVAQVQGSSALPLPEARERARRPHLPAGLRRLSRDSPSAGPPADKSP